MEPIGEIAQPATSLPMEPIGEGSDCPISSQTGPVREAHSLVAPGPQSRQPFAYPLAHTLEWIPSARPTTAIDIVTDVTHPRDRRRRNGNVLQPFAVLAVPLPCMRSALVRRGVTVNDNT
ncbi:hypothetical protein EYR40_001641 [Pleurotus pulmonarius]|nr:hypothetical protein EYR40_001641 [Pleurotus pulmonarius]